MSKIKVLTVGKRVLYIEDWSSPKVSLHNTFHLHSSLLFSWSSFCCLPPFLRFPHTVHCLRADVLRISIPSLLRGLPINHHYTSSLFITTTPAKTLICFTHVLPKSSVLHYTYLSRKIACTLVRHLPIKTCLQQSAWQYLFQITKSK